MLREFTPGQRVQARIEVTGPGLLRRSAGGIDLMGDGVVVAYTGAYRKVEVDAADLDQALASLHSALEP